MIVGELEIRLMADVARIKSDMDKVNGIVGNTMANVEKMVSSAKEALVGLGAVSLAAGFGASVRAALELADSMGKLAQRSGVAVEDLTRLQYAARLSGVGTEAMATGLKKLNVSIAEAASGSKEQNEAFKALGISVVDTSGRMKSADRILVEMAEAFSNAEDGAGKTAVAVKLLGKAGDEMIPLLNAGADELEKLTKEADKLGATIGKDFAKAAEQFNDNMERVKVASESWAKVIATDVVPVLNVLAQTYADNAQGATSMNLASQALLTVLEAVSVLAANVAFVLKGIGNEIGGIAAQAAALMRGDWDGFKAIGEAMKADAQQARKELEAFEKSILNAQKNAKDLRDQRLQEDRGFNPFSKQINYGGGGSEKPDAAAAAFKSMNDELVKRKDLLEEEIKTGLHLTDARKFEIEQLAKLTAQSKDWSEAKKQIIRDQIAEVKADMEVVQARKELDEAIKKNVERLLKEHQAIEEFDASRRQSIRESLKTQEDRERSLKDEIAALKISVGQNISLAEAVERVAIARLQERQAEKFFEGSEGWKAIDEEIKKRQELLGLMKDKAVLDEWQKTTDSIREGLTDALMRGFESGKSFAKNLRDTLSNMFKTLVLRPVISAIFNPVAAGLAGMLGVSSAAQAAGSSSSGSAIGTLGGLASLFGSGGLGGSVMAGAGWLTGATSLTGSLSAAGSLIGTGTTGGIMSGIGMGVGALGPIVAGLALLSSLAKSFKGETRAGGQYGYSFDGSSAFNARRGTSVGANGIGAVFLEGPSGGDPNQANALIGVNTAVGGINSRFAALGSNTRVTGFGAGYETSDKGRGGVFAGGTLTGGMTFGESGKGDNYAGTLFESTSTQSPDAKAAWENFTTDLLQASIQALQADSQLPESVKKIVKDVNAEALSTDAATQLLTQVDTLIAGVTKFKEAVGLMPFDDLQRLSFDAAAALIELAGGIDNLTGQLNSYYQNFYTEEERRAQQLKNITSVLEKANVVVPKTNEEFRALVEKYMAMGESGQQALAALLSVNQAFAELYPLATDAANGVDDLADATEKFNAALDDALAVLKKSIDAEKERLGIEKAVHQEALAAARAVYDISHSNAQSLYGMNPAVAAMSGAQGRAFISNAAFNASASGYLPESAALGDAVSAARGSLDSRNFKTVRDQQFAMLTLAGDLASLEKISGQQKTIEEQQLDALDAQIKALDDLYDQQETLVKAAQGIDTSVLSVSAALEKLTALMFPNLNKPAEVPSGVPMSGGPSTSSWGGRLAGSSSGFTIDANGFRRYDDGSGSMLSEGELDLWRRGLLGNVPMPAFATGTPYVPQDGPAFLHEGEAVLPAPVAQRWRDSEGSTSAQLVAEIRILNGRVDAMAKDTARTRKRLEDMSPQGDRLQTNEVGAT